MTDKNVIYICTKLFNYNDKLQAEYFEESLKKIQNTSIFMPFRDTDENNIVGPNRTKIVYDADIERLNSGEIILLAALYDGICKDEGISFEIGYAYGKGIPIFLVNTDFIWYAINEREFLFDPVVEYMSSGCTHYYEIDANIPFKQALVLGQRKAFDIAANEISKILQSNNDSHENVCRGEKNRDVFIDFNGGKFEYQREYAIWLKNELSKKNISVVIADRYCDNSAISNSQKGLHDIECLLDSKCYICLGDEPEISSGTAALLGLARCSGIKTILYESSDVEIHGENGHRMKKNLMIDFSIDRVAKTKKQIIDIILEEISV